MSALFFWLPALSRSPSEVADAERSMSETNRFGSEEVRRLKETKEIHELLDVAGGIMNRKPAKPKNAAE
jgi:hypothetical protein